MLQEFDVRQKFLSEKVFSEFNFITADQDGYQIEKVILEPYISELNLQNDMNRQLHQDFYEMKLKHFIIPQKIPLLNIDLQQVI